MKRHFANMVFALILAAYTVYAVLDTFVIVRVLTPDTLPTATAEASTAPTEAPTAAPTATEPPAEQATTTPISTDTEYHDDQIDIVLTTMRVENTTVYVADVQIADISLLKTALAGNTYARNLTETTSVQAANAGAILAINGDYYGAQERGYVLRNGVLYRASAQSGTDALVIGSDGNFRIITEGETSADTLVHEGAWQVLTFGPALLPGVPEHDCAGVHQQRDVHLPAIAGESGCLDAFVDGTGDCVRRGAGAVPAAVFPDGRGDLFHACRRCADGNPLGDRAGTDIPLTGNGEVRNIEKPGQILRNRGGSTRLCF